MGGSSERLRRDRRGQPPRNEPREKHRDRVQEPADDAATAMKERPEPDARAALGGHEDQLLPPLDLQP